MNCCLKNHNSKILLLIYFHLYFKIILDSFEKMIKD
jgi:hypothetical protein